MVHEGSADFLSSHWQVIDVNTGDVLSEGDLNLKLDTFGRLSGRFDGRGGGGHRRDRDHRRLDRLTNTGSAGLGAAVLWLNYSDDGELLVSGADDGGVSLWDATTLDLLGTVYPPHQGDPVPAGAQFIGDSHDVAIASYDGKRLPVGDRPRPGHRLRLPDGRPEPDRRRSGKSSCPPSPTSPSARASERRPSPGTDVGERTGCVDVGLNSRPCAPLRRSRTVAASL